MSANYYELLKYAATGQASPSMTYYDRMRASAISSMKKPAMDDYAAIAKIVRAGKAKDFLVLVNRSSANTRRQTELYTTCRLISLHLTQKRLKMAQLFRQ